MRYKLADANDPRDFDFSTASSATRPRSRRGSRVLGAKVDDVEPETEYAFRVDAAVRRAT